MLKKKIKKEVKRELRKMFCPQCGGTKIIMEIGGQMGIYRRVKCNYRASIFPEKLVDIKRLRKLKNKENGN